MSKNESKKLPVSMPQEEFDHYWENRGLQYRFEDFYRACKSWGLSGISRENYLTKVYNLISEVLVEGQKVMPELQRDSTVPEWYA